MARSRSIRALTFAAAVGLLASGPHAPAAKGDGTPGGVRALNDPPSPVFILHPTPDSTGGIVGTTPFTITINLCQSTDTDAGDEMRYRYDFEGEGEFERGRCRVDHTYFKPGAFTVTACVSDRQPDHESCQTWTASVTGENVQPTGPFTFSFSIVLADVNADGCADYASLPWGETSIVGVPGTQAQVWVPLADTNEDNKPDSIAMDLDNNNVIDPDLQLSGKLAGNCAATTSISRPVGPTFPILIDNNGNGPDETDTKVVPIRTGNQITLNAPWDTTPNGNNVFTLGGGTGPVFTSATRPTDFGANQTMTVTGFTAGGATGFAFTEQRLSGGTKTGSGGLLDTNGDGIFDTVEGAPN